MRERLAADGLDDEMDVVLLDGELDDLERARVAAIGPALPVEGLAEHVVDELRAERRKAGARPEGHVHRVRAVVARPDAMGDRRTLADGALSACAGPRAPAARHARGGVHDGRHLELERLRGQHARRVCH